MSYCHDGVTWLNDEASQKICLQHSTCKWDRIWENDLIDYDNDETRNEIILDDQAVHRRETYTKRTRERKAL